MSTEYNHLKKRLKLIQYFKDKIGSTGVLFLQETYTTSKEEQKLKGNFKVHVFFLIEKQILVMSYLLHFFTIKKQKN